MVGIVEHQSNSISSRPSIQQQQSSSTLLSSSNNNKNTFQNLRMNHTTTPSTAATNTSTNPNPNPNPNSVTKLTRAAMARRFFLRNQRSSTKSPSSSPTSSTSTSPTSSTTTHSDVPSPSSSPMYRTNTLLQEGKQVCNTNNNHDKSFGDNNSSCNSSRGRRSSTSNNMFRNQRTTSSNYTSKVTATSKTSSSSSNTIPTSSSYTCVLCYDNMHILDAQIHPIICMNCSFNCCTDCMYTFLQQQQQQDEQQPSTSIYSTNSNDQNLNNKKKIPCPQCRSDLSRTIYDTALLRTMDQCSIVQSSNIQQQQQQQQDNTNKSIFNEYNTNDLLRYEIDMARKREIQFIQYSQQQQKKNRIQIDDDVLLNEQQSINNTNHDSTDSSSNNNSDHYYEWWYYYDRNQYIDTTLLCGLENIMTWYEQEYITKCYISGTTQQLAIAAKLLHSIQNKLQQQQNESEQPSLSLSSIASSGLVVDTKESIVSTLYQFIEAGKKARYRSRKNMYHQHNRYPSTSSNELISVQQSSSSSSSSPNTPIQRKIPDYYTKLATQKATQFRKVEHEVRQQTAYMKRYPLPNRIPKYCEFSIVLDMSNDTNDNHVSVSQIVKRLPFRFCNDQWDGSIMDAYTKFIIQRCTSSFLNDPKKLLRGKNYSDHRPTKMMYNSTFVDNYKVHQRRPYDDTNIQNILSFENITTTDVVSHDDTDTPIDDTRDACTVAKCKAMDDERCVCNDTTNPKHQQQQTPKPTEANDNARVMIASVINMNVARMVFQGDVVTHLNGIELHDYTVDDIIALICSLCDSDAVTTTTYSDSINDNDNKNYNNSVPSEATTTTTTAPPPPPPSSSPIISTTLSMIDDTINLFTNASSTSIDDDYFSNGFTTPPSTTSHKTTSGKEQQQHHGGNNNKTNSSKSNTQKMQKVLPLQFVFNADVAVAKVLQLRATAIRLQQQNDYQ
jgi:hypothetical protein